MVEDLIKRLRDWMGDVHTLKSRLYSRSRTEFFVPGSLAPELLRRSEEMCDEVIENTREAADALADANAHIAALESERDALLAAAGKEAVAVAWFDKERNTVRWKDGLVNADFRDGQPFFTAPQAECARMEFKPVIGNDHMYVHGTHEAIDALKERLTHDYRMLAQAECAPRDAWQPIETAPKDGTEVLLYLGNPWSKTEKARWYAPWSNWQVGAIPSDPVREEYFGIGKSVPTHWMPLPAPPAALSQKAGEQQ
jgi:hypothetical protein